MQSTRLAVRVLSVAFVAALLGACATTEEPVSDTDTTTTPVETTTEAPDPGAVDRPEVETDMLDDPYGSATQSGLEEFAGSDRVFFEFDSSELTVNARQILQQQAEWLNHFGNVDVTVEGHCDERGTREYNLALGERRASAVKDYLIALGVSADRIDTISYGKERPAVVGRTESAFAKNRRGVLRVE